MEKLTIEKQLKKYPYLQRISDYTLFATKEDIDFIKNSKTIAVGDIDVYTEFLKRILEDDNYFEYACRYFYDATGKFIVSSIINGDLGVNIRYDKTTIINGIKELINTNQISLNTEEKERFEKLRSYISYDNFLEKYKNYEYKVLIDGVNYSIPFENMINLNLFSFQTIKITAIVLFVIYLIDYIISLIIMFGFKGTLKTVEKDGTEEITKKVKDILINKNVLYKRLVEAFPNFMNPKERLLLIKARVEKELKKYIKKDQK